MVLVVDVDDDGDEEMSVVLVVVDDDGYDEVLVLLVVDGDEEILVLVVAGWPPMVACWIRPTHMMMITLQVCFNGAIGRISLQKRTLCVSRSPVC